MKELVPNDLEDLPVELFDKALKRVSSKPGEKYKFIVRGGYSLKNALFVLFSTVWKNESIPDSWHESELVQLWKGKGSKSILDNMRHLHIKKDTQKMFNQMVTIAAEDKLIANMSKFQLASKPGHRATEHLFVVMSMMLLNEKIGDGMIVTLFDLTKYFDKESAVDCHYELYKSEIKGKLYRLLFLLNKNIRIRVKTPVGLTDAEDTGAGVGQGTVSGAITSSVNLDNGVKEYFHDEGDNPDAAPVATRKKAKMEVVKYDDIALAPLLYQDDLFNMSNSREAAQEANDRMESLLESKLLDLNTQKTCFIITGGKKGRKRLEKDVENSPLMIYNSRMKQVTVEKYLGMQLAATAAASVTATVNKRLGLATRAIYEARAVIEDHRSQAVGGIVAAFEIWERSAIPML